MRDERNPRFSASFFAFRTPLLPFADFLAWGDEGSLDRETLRSRLRDVFTEPLGQETLLVASHELPGAFQHWLDDPEGERGRGVERALTRYFSRMTGRPTPFGLFAGMSVGLIDEKTHLELQGSNAYRRSSRLDLGHLHALVTKLAAEPDLSRRLTYRPNPTVYRVGERLRYVESRLEEKDVRHELVAVKPTRALGSTLARAEAGATVGELVEALGRDGADAYVEDLIENDLLQAELRLPVTGDEPLDSVTRQLNGEPEADRLERVREALRALDDSALGEGIPLHSRIRDAVEALVPESDEAFLQVDLFKPSPNATLGADVVTELLRGAEALRRLSPKPEETELDRFRGAFQARYESREVSLLEALDPDLGVGFPPIAHDQSPQGVPLLKEITFPAGVETTSWGAREKLLLRKLTEALDRRDREIVLTAVDLEGLDEGLLPLPDAFAVTGAVAASSQDALDRGRFRVLLESVHGPSGAILLGRFCHGDPQLRGLVEEHLRAEEALEPDAIFAEIVHLPEGRMGNISCRPVLRDYEITYLGESGASADRQIPVSDLLVSIHGGELRLRSERLGRRVVPRMTNAHNYRAFGTPAYRFLAYLQHQGVRAGMRWSWKPLDAAPFLPRVRLGRLVLSRARWNLKAEELARESWWADRGLPRLVAVEQGDDLLPVDLENALSVDSFVQLVKARGEASVVEVFPGPDELCAEGPEGRFVHHLVVPFVRDAKNAPTVRPSIASGSVRRRFMPGTEWLSAAIYAGPALADELLLSQIGPLARRLVDAGTVDRWFFIRYGDPEWHLRVRLHVDPAIVRSEVQPALEEAGDAAWRLAFDTYEREVERYGGPQGIELAERIFHIDSEAVLELLEGPRLEEERWRTALVGMDALLDDFGLDLNAKALFAQRRRDGFARELKADTSTKAKLGERFRRERHGLEVLLTTHPPMALARRSERLRPLLSERLDETFVDCFVHMHLNRMLRSAHRKQEFVLYDFLARLYRAQLARGTADSAV